MKRYTFISLMILSVLFCRASGFDSVPDSELSPEQKANIKLIESTRVIGINPLTNKPYSTNEDSIRWLISRFYVDQYRHFQDPKAPYFMFMSKNANLALGVGGVVRMRGYYDWNGSIPANGFIPYLIQIPKDPTNKRKLSATPAGTALFFSLIGRDSKLGDYMGYIEANFNGYQGLGFKLKKAYVTLNDWTVGYATTSFSDPKAQPPLIDGAGPNGDLTKSAVLVRYLHPIGKNWFVGGSFEFPDSQIGDDASKYTKKCTDYFPDIVATGQYSWNGGLSHIRLAALLKMMSYRNLLTEKNHNVIGWGTQISAVVKIMKPLTLYGSANVGQGHSSYMGDLSISNYDLINKPDQEGVMYAPTSLGLTFGAKYYILDNVYAGLALGELRYFPKAPQEGSEYKYGLYGAINLFWDIMPRLQVGIEYLAGKRMNFDHSHGNSNRIDALFMFSF
ncbi:MAG: DcaP family trimeric outer membrane transporter [Prevotella sp.]|nr:DcaP family trimeric outer membrane transporter [Bacteroides sp.]MCM1366440.1 DcaP family trimeric outer membrane transporter [Prevotella sp.]